MNENDVVRRRLHNQGLATAPFPAPAAAVRWLGAVQAQEYAPAKWSLRQRIGNGTEDDVERAVVRGAVLRTHVLRPTWHFVHCDDIRWLVELSAPRVQAMAAHRRRELGLDDVVIRRSTAVIAGALEGGCHLTRNELASVLRQAGIRTDGQVMPHVLMHLELDTVICSGVPRGKQQTYALLEERSPDAAWLPRDEALAELTARYFTSHGPATAKDLQWWASSTATDVKRGIDIMRAELEHADIAGRRYWFRPAQEPVREARVRAHIVPQFDEILVGYSESRDVFDPARLLPRGQTLTRAVLVDGQIVARWQRSARTRDFVIEPLRTLSAAERSAIAEAIDRARTPMP